MDKILIVGLGLLGGSLGMALRGAQYVRYGWARRPETRKLALECDAVEHTGDDVDELLRQADLTVLALPVPEIVNFIKAHAGAWKPGAVVTDIGSIKEEIVRTGNEVLAPLGVFFVGSHPMAGTEKSGLENSFARLYDNADTFVIPSENETAVHKVEAMWQAAGAHCVRIEPHEHDILVAHTSHVPHILASALALSVLNTDDEDELRRRFAGCATGFRDTSRIASSSPVMWREIIENNRQAVLEAIDDYEKYFEAFRTIVKEKRFDEFEKLFGKGRELRDSWLKYKEREK